MSIVEAVVALDNKVDLLPSTINTPDGTYRIKWHVSADKALRVTVSGLMSEDQAKQFYISNSLQKIADDVFIKFKDFYKMYLVCKEAFKLGT